MKTNAEGQNAKMKSSCQCFHCSHQIQTPAAPDLKHRGRAPHSISLYQLAQSQLARWDLLVESC